MDFRKIHHGGTEAHRILFFTDRETTNTVALRVAPKARSLGPERRTCAGCKWRVQGGRRPALLVLCFFGIKTTVLGRRRPVKRAGLQRMDGRGRRTGMSL